MALFPVFGKTPTGQRLQRIRLSPNYEGAQFKNLTHTDVTLPGTSFLKMLKEFRDKPADTVPAARVPAIRTDLRSLPDDRVSIVWFGHSSYLLKIHGTCILVDPVFSANAAPVSFFARAFPATTTYTAEDMPAIDMLLLTHDHYDHLDYKTIRQLDSRVGHFYTSLGVGAHLQSWGIGAGRITELDWWEGCDIGQDGRPMDGGPVDGSGHGAEKGWIRLTATPARHFSGRGLKRGGTLWSSFVLKTDDYSFFLGGDSGYETHFRMIGERYGPFDIAILECGQYGKNWPSIHMQPEQTVQAALDLRARLLLPVHWAKFALALHPWREPIRRLVAAAGSVGLPVTGPAGVPAAGAAGMPLTTPRIGEPVLFNQPYPVDHWWEAL